jgi:AraC family transcriptional activator of tynA and feaB
LEKIFNSDDVHPRDRLSYWHDVGGGYYVGHECSFDRSICFSVQIDGANLGPLVISTLRADATSFLRQQRHIRSDCPEHAFICMQLEGSTLVRQDGREETIWPGDFVLLDASRPYDLVYRGLGRLLVLKVPADDMRRRVGATDAVTAIAARKSGFTSGLAAGFIGMLLSHVPTTGEWQQARIADHALDLVALALTDIVLDRQPTLSSAKTVALTSLRHAVDGLLATPHVEAEEIAAAAGMSVRYANRLLAEQGTSIGRYIVTRRLEQCRRVLADPAQSHRSITEICHGWGFADAAHFARRFKEAYGVSPRDYRPGRSRDS